MVIKMGGSTGPSGHTSAGTAFFAMLVLYKASAASASAFEEISGRLTLLVSSLSFSATGTEAVYTMTSAREPSWHKELANNDLFNSPLKDPQKVSFPI